MLTEMFEEILGCASGYSATTPNDLMLRREVLLKSATELVRDWLSADLASSSLESLALEVDRGGRVANFAPVPWVRVFSPAYSPKATAGYYIVWLFGATGERMYLSLNQGTSEWRSNAMRPLNDDSELKGRADFARAELGEEALALFPSGVSNISLGVEQVDVGDESKRRAKNYELANILGVEYIAGSVPDDEALREDLSTAIALLAELYQPSAAALSDGKGASDKKSKRPKRARGGGFGPKEVNDVVEDWAMLQVSAHFDGLDWAVEDVSRQKIGYDLRCSRDGVEIAVEVKGTQGDGLKVPVTLNEVRSARENSNTQLAVVYNIKVDIGVDPPVASGGLLRFVDPWKAEPENLIPYKLFYTLP